MNLTRSVLASGALACSFSSIAQTSEIVLDPGQGCEFGLRIEIQGGNQVSKTFVDKNGNVRMLSAGQGSQLTFYNLSSNNKLTTRPNGSVTQTTVHSPISQTIVQTGHNVIILFPDDDPPGPDTTLYVGRIEFAFDPTTGHIGIRRFSGRTTDLCAALS